MKETNIECFLKKKNKTLLEFYENSPREIKKMMVNIFKACFRFGLGENQTNYMLEQALQPFKSNLLLEMFN